MVLDLASGKDVTRGDMRDSPCTAAAFSGDGRVVATGFNTNRDGVTSSGVRLWEFATGRLIRELTGPTAELSFVVFSADGGSVYASSYDHKVWVWDARTGRQLRSLTGHAGWVWGVALAPDERSVASASADGRLVIWDLADLGKRPVDKTKPLTAKQLDSCYADLASFDAARADAAIQKLLGDPTQAIPYLRKKLPELRPRAGPSPEQVASLIAELDDAEFSVRQRASEQLVKAGPRIVPELRKASAGSASLEAKRRLTRLMARLEPDNLSAEEMTFLRLVQVVEAAGTPEARKLLEGVVADPPSLRTSEEASLALERLRRPGKASFASP
jgi:hypothetical protein